MVIKLDSFFSPLHVLSNKYEGNSEYVNAIVHYRQGKMEEAIAIIDSLVQSCNPAKFNSRTECCVGFVFNSCAAVRYGIKVKWIRITLCFPSL
jgi:hypothetical protein